MKKSLSFLVLVALIVAMISAAPLPSTRNRADDLGLWHFEDNPALIGAVQDHIITGLSYNVMDATGAALSDAGFGSIEVAGLLPILGYYDMTFEPNSFDLTLGESLAFGKAFALGYDYSWSSATSGFTSYGLGLLLRPASFLSLGLSGNLQATGSYEAGFGLALRPFALSGNDTPISRALSLSADMSWTESAGLGLENIGFRLLVSDMADLRAWYAPVDWNFSDGRIGLELRIALGPSGVSAMLPSAAQSPQGWRVADDIDLRRSDLKTSPSSLPSSSVGRRILVVKDLDEIRRLPALGRNPFAFFSSKRTITFPELIALLEQARLERGVAAVAFENLPSLGGPADYQEFVAELGLLRKAGKKVYFYGESFGREYALFASQADGISLNPLGALALNGLAYRRAYFKTFFDGLGIRFVNLAPWDTKSAFNSLTDSAMPPGEEAMMRRFYGDIQDQLGLSLAAGRGEKLPLGPAAAFDGGPYLDASEAYHAGLVDSVAYAGEFEDSLRKSHPGSALVSGLGFALSESWGSPAFKRHAAVVWLTGSIGLGKGRAGEEIGSSAALEIERLRKDPSVAGIVLRVDSPGGAVLTSDLIAREVRLAVEGGKPVVVSMGRYAASGGYYISAPASWIVAEPTTVTGSIGVTGLVPNISEALRKLGVKYDGFDLSPGASFLDPAKEQDEAELAKTEVMIHAMYDRFVAVVAAGRKMDAEAVRKIGEGNIWTGREAGKLGLVDELGGLAEAKAWLEAKLGGSLTYFDLIPGEGPSLLSPLGGLTSALKAALGTVGGDDLESLLGPVAAKLKSLFDLGQGALYYLDVDALAP